MKSHSTYLIIVILIFYFLFPKFSYGSNNKKIYGTYEVAMTEGDCSAVTTYLTVGQKKGRRGTNNYLYIPYNTSSLKYKKSSFIYSVKIRGRNVYVKKRDGQGKLTLSIRYTFSKNYNKGTIVGNSKNDDLSPCKGSINGNLKKVEKVKKTVSYLETDSRPSSLTIRNNNMFWSDASETPIKQLDKKGNILSLARQIGVPSDIMVNDQYVFWTDDRWEWGGSCSNGLRILYRTSLDGSETTELARGSNCRDIPANILVDDSYIYWINSSVSPDIYRIVKTPIIGGNSIIVTETSEQIVAITGDATNIYWEEHRFQDSARNAILKIPKNGGIPAVVTEGFTYLQGNLVVTNGELIFADDYSKSTTSFKYRIMKVSISDGTITTIADVNSYPNENNIRKIAVDGTDVYWADKKSINKISINGGSITELAPVQNYIVNDLALNNDTVFWTESPLYTYLGGPLRSVPKAGGTVEVLYQDKVTPYSLSIGSNDIYWTEPGGIRDGFARIVKRPLNGGEPTTIASGISKDSPLITADDSSIYIADEFAIKRLSQNGGQAEILARNITSIDAIATDGIDVYWLSDQLYKMSVNGGNAIPLASEGDGPINVINGYVYWMKKSWTDHNDSIFRVPTSGGPVETITSGLSFIDYFVVDGMYVYSSECGSGIVSKIPVNGGGRTIIASYRACNRILALDNETLYWVDQYGLKKISIYGKDFAFMTTPFYEIASGLAISDTSAYFTFTSSGTGYIFEVTPK